MGEPSHPTTIFADDAPHRLAAALAELGTRRVLLVSGPSRRFVDRIGSALSDMAVEVFDETRTHVPLGVVEAAHARAVAHEADVVVTVGGGACTGLGKALRLRMPLRFVALPTTYAGSEMTSIWGITSEGRKETGRDDRVRPDLVLYDPALTRDM